MFDRRFVKEVKTKLSKPILVKKEYSGQNDSSWEGRYFQGFGPKSFLGGASPAPYSKGPEPAFEDRPPVSQPISAAPLAVVKQYSVQGDQISPKIKEFNQKLGGLLKDKMRNVLKEFPAYLKSQGMSLSDMRRDDTRLLPPLEQFLQNYTWPPNVHQELINTISNEKAALIDELNQFKNNETQAVETFISDMSDLYSQQELADLRVKGQDVIQAIQEVIVDIDSTDPKKVIDTHFNPMNFYDHLEAQPSKIKDFMQIMTKPKRVL